MRKIKPDDFRVRAGRKVRLSKWPTNVKPVCGSQEEYQELLGEHVHKLSALQSLLYAADSYSLLLIFQAMDAAGKDSAIKHVMSGINPQGCQVFSFKHPGPEELNHDFLWNATRRLPERGRIGIFNRSYYEEVLVARVHPEIIAGQKLPPQLFTKRIWDERYEDIRSYERYLGRNGIVVRKIFLHVSKAEQKRRFLARLDEPEKNWKFSSADARERGFWKDYQRAYEDAIAATATKHAPWFVIPSNHKWFRNLAVSEIVADTLDAMKLELPKPTVDLKEIRRLYHKDAKEGTKKD